MFIKVGLNVTVLLKTPQRRKDRTYFEKGSLKEALTWLWGGGRP